MKNNIPQEEPKQETLEEYSNGLYKQSLKDDVDLTFSDGVKLGAKWQQEKLEEYIKEVTKNFGDEMSVKFTSGGIKLGAKWQAEKMYSEEEVSMILQEFKRYLSFGDEVSESEWLRQFKKK
jgi:hypothetical protein